MTRSIYTPRPCPQCNKPFRPATARAQYCSDKCRAYARRQRLRSLVVVAIIFGAWPRGPAKAEPASNDAATLAGFRRLIVEQALPAALGLEAGR